MNRPDWLGTSHTNVHLSPSTIGVQNASNVHHLGPLLCCSTLHCRCSDKRNGRRCRKSVLTVARRSRIYGSSAGTSLTDGGGSCCLLLPSMAQHQTLMKYSGVKSIRAKTTCKGNQAARFNMGAVDPTYPLYPITCILASAMLLLVLTTSFVRQSWNLGVAFLCFWLFFELVTGAVNAIVWSDNADMKLYVYCDIGMQFICSQRHGSSYAPCCSFTFTTYYICRQAHGDTRHHTATLPHCKSPVRGTSQ